jgi:DNA-3-methyladenine glycosylase
VTRDFYDRPVLEVAEDLVGCTLTHGDTAGVILETEAYHWTEEACHAYVGITPRTEVIWGPPAIAYVYRSYGIHALFNAVCEPDGVGAAVLVRALEPTDGLEVMRMRRGAGRRPGPVQRPGQAHPGARDRPRAQPLVAARRADRHRARGPPAVRGRRGGPHGAAHRHHPGRRARLAVHRGRPPRRLAAVSEGRLGRGGTPPD